MSESQKPTTDAYRNGWERLWGAKVVVDENVPPNTLYGISPRYKTVPVGSGEPPRFETVLDMEETAKASFLIKNIGAE